MRLIGPSTEDEMVLAFLRAEAYSPRFKAHVVAGIGGDRSLIYQPRLDDPSQNARRRQALAYRGYGSGQLLFRGIPNQVEWLRIALTRAELGNLKYANYPTWVTLSGGSRLVRDGAANVGRVRPQPEDVTSDILAVEREMVGGRTPAEMIFIAKGREEQHLVFEGHTRATAYYRALAEDAEIEALAGYSPAMSGWVFY